jgi:hypothetical protein
MILLKSGIYFKLKDFLNLVDDIDYHFEVPNLSFVKKLSSILRNKFKLPVTYLNLEDYHIDKKNIYESEFLFSFPNLVLLKKSDFTPTLAISPVYEIEISMPIDVLYSPEANDTDKSYTLPDFITHRDFRLEGMSELSLLYEIYERKNSSDLILKILRDNDDDSVYFKLDIYKDGLRLTKLDKIDEDILTIVDKGWLKFLEAGYIRFFGKMLYGKFTLEKKNDSFVLNKIARQPSTTWEINEPYFPFNWLSPVSISSDSGLYLQTWPYQWAKYPGESLLSTLLELLKSLGNESLKEKVKDVKKVKKIDDVEEFLKELEREGNQCWKIWKSSYKDNVTYKNFLKGWLIKKIAEEEKDLTRLTDEDKNKFYLEVKRIKEELKNKLDGYELKAEMFKRLKILFPDLKDKTIFLAIDKINKEATTYDDNEQPVILGDDYGVNVFPHHDFPENSNDVLIEKPFHLDEFDRSYIYALPTAGSYLIALPNGDQLIVDEEDLKKFKKKYLKKKLSKAIVDMVRKIVGVNKEEEEGKDKKKLSPEEAFARKLEKYLEGYSPKTKPKEEEVKEEKEKRTKYEPFYQLRIKNLVYPLVEGARSKEGLLPEKALGLIEPDNEEEFKSAYLNTIFINLDLLEESLIVEKNALKVSFKCNLLIGKKEYYFGLINFYFSPNSSFINKGRLDEAYFIEGYSENPIYIFVENFDVLIDFLKKIHASLFEYMSSSKEEFFHKNFYIALRISGIGTSDLIPFKSEFPISLKKVINNLIIKFLDTSNIHDRILEVFKSIIDFFRRSRFPIVLKINIKPQSDEMSYDLNAELDWYDKKESFSLGSISISLDRPSSDFEILQLNKVSLYLSFNFSMFDNLVNRVGEIIKEIKEKVGEKINLLVKVDIILENSFSKSFQVYDISYLRKMIVERILGLVKADLLKNKPKFLALPQLSSYFIEEGAKIVPKYLLEEKLGKEMLEEIEKEIEQKGYYEDKVTGVLYHKYPLDERFLALSGNRRIL